MSKHCDDNFICKGKKKDQLSVPCLVKVDSKQCERGRGEPPFGKSYVALCSDTSCDEIAVGKAWDMYKRDRSNVYCRKHLELAKKSGHPIKLFSDTDVIYDE